MPDVGRDIWLREDVSQWDVVIVEQSGSNVTEWLEPPGTSERWLHKNTVTPSNGVEQGEDWSEVVSTQIALALGIPCASTRLCLREGRRGSLSRHVCPPEHGYSLDEGWVALTQCEGVTDYFRHTEDVPGHDPKRPGVRRPGHSLANIAAALQYVEAPPNFGGPAEMSAFEVFAGYLVFDALVANADRHEQNWAVLTPQLVTASARLAPSYDHASSLGFNLQDLERRIRLDKPGGLEAWASRGLARRFEYVGKPSSLVELASQAVEACTPGGADYWRQRLNEVDLSAVQTAVLEGVIPSMSVDASRFVTELLNVNLRRLRDAV